MTKKTETTALTNKVSKRSTRTKSGETSPSKIQRGELKKASVSASSANVDVEKSPANVPNLPSDLLEDLGSLPRSYGEEMVFLVAQDPNWLFTYWDIDISRHPGGPCFLRVEDAAGILEAEIEVSFETRNWYIPVKKAGGSYSVEIGYHRHGKWNPISRSPIATTPQDRFSESTAFDFATLPMHISFQRLVETLSQSFASSDQLLPALIHLQQTLPTGGSSGFSLDAREREILQVLLGSELLVALSSGQWSSEELHSAIHQRLRESLTSGIIEEIFSRLSHSNSESHLLSSFQNFSREMAGSSALLSSAGLAALFTHLEQRHSESSLFSGLQRLFSEHAASSESLSSAAFSELLAGNISSWLTGFMTSWGGVTSSERTSLLSLASSWSGPELSSASEFAARTALSSWLAEEGSSWKGGEVSVQALAAISSWSSEIMAAQGFAASSWSASQN
jgi:hypothetical protein